MLSISLRKFQDSWRCLQRTMKEVTNKYPIWATIKLPHLWKCDSFNSRHRISVKMIAQTLKLQISSVCTNLINNINMTVTPLCASASSWWKTELSNATPVFLQTQFGSGTVFFLVSKNKTVKERIIKGQFVGIEVM